MVTYTTGILTSLYSGMSSPYGVNVDSSGNVYVCNGYHQVIKYSSSGTSVFAGTYNTGSFSGDEGEATSATLKSPSGIGVDASDNIYIGDASNCRIRKVSTLKPSPSPTYKPTYLPSGQPSSQPSLQPSGQPSLEPTVKPSSQPSGQPSSNPTCPSTHPTSQPSRQPSRQPTTQPSMSLVELAVFSVTLNYQNIDLRDWNAAKLHHEESLKESLVENILGLHEDDIIDVSAVDKSTRRLTATDTIYNTSIPTECKAFLLRNNGEFSIQDQRKLIVKKLQIVVTFNIRPQYFNRTYAASSADVYNTVTLRMNSSVNNILLDLQSDSTYFASAVLLSTTFSSYSSIISRSAFPSSSPTSQPSCGTGSYQVGIGCSPCKEGYYANTLNAFQCTACPVGTYTNIEGLGQCIPCGKFTTNIKEASTGCPNFNLNASAFICYTLGSFVAILFLTSLLFAGENMYIMFTLGIFPFLDIVSDMIYILSVKFWTVELFVCATLFFVIPSLMFIFKLVRMKAYPRLIKFVGLDIMNDRYIWLTVSPDGYPLINGERSILSYEEHDGIEKLTWYWLLWILLFVCQFFFILSSVIWYMVASIFLVAWLITGLFLYQTKMLAVGKVWNVWFFTFTQSNNFNKEINLDASVLNESLFYEFILETVPQIAIQSINNSLIYSGHFPTISVFSLAMSIFIAINGIYRYGYFLLWKGVKFNEIPLPLAVRVQKINIKSVLPRRSMIIRKLASLVDSVKVSDSSIVIKAAPDNLRHVSHVMGTNDSTPPEIINAIMLTMEIGITKLHSISVADSKQLVGHIHKFDELVFALRNLIMNQRNATAVDSNFTGDDAREYDEESAINISPIDVDGIRKRTSQILPITVANKPELSMADVKARANSKGCSSIIGNNNNPKYARRDNFDTSRIDQNIAELTVEEVRGAVGAVKLDYSIFDELSDDD